VNTGAVTRRDYSKFERKEVSIMYEKVLVPLDGSKLAETTLPHVTKMAQAGFIKEVVLLNVVEIPSFWVTESVDLVKFEEDQRIRAKSYLDDVQARLNAEGIKARTEMREDHHAAEAIVNYAKSNHFDLIVIASHGFSGMMRWVFGSVALRVLHESKIPVLLIRPEDV